MTLQSHMLGKGSMIAVSKNTMGTFHTLVVHGDTAIGSHFSYIQKDIRIITSFFFFLSLPPPKCVTGFLASAKTFTREAGTTSI